jgi:hypothetical protein
MTVLLIGLSGLAGLAMAAGPAVAGQHDPYDYYRSQGLWESRTGVQWLDQNQDGVVDYAQDPRLWGGAGFGDWLDANGDGVCDNFATHPQDGTGNGWRGGR